MYINLEEQKVRVEDFISNLIPDFILEENPLFLDFLKTYFRSREAYGSDVDLVRNILKYRTVEKLFSIVESTTLSSNIESYDSIITVESTEGWPDKYGLLQIDDEIIGYEYKTDTQFVNCYRGFSGATSLGKYTNNNSYIFNSTVSAGHSSGTLVKNVGNLFLKEFLFYFKQKYLPGFENISFYEGIDPNLVLSKVKDFYSAKGTLNSFEILFKLLYGEESQVILPKENTLSPSNSLYIDAFTVVVEVKSGDVENIKGSSIYQEENSAESIPSAVGVVYNVDFLTSKELPARIFEGATATQSGNIITINLPNHGFSMGDPVFVEFSADGEGETSISRVFPEIYVTDLNTFSVYAEDSRNILTQNAIVNSIKTSKSDFYRLQLNKIDGEFVFSGKTQLISDVNVTDTSIFVDSTIGFPESGSIEIEGDIIHYESKSSNIFKGCTDIGTFKDSGSDVTLTRTVYSYENGDISKRVVMRLVDITTNKFGNEDVIVKDETRLKIKNVGYPLNDRVIDSWIVNNQLEMHVKTADHITNSIEFYGEHNLYNGDLVNVSDFYVTNKNGIRNRNYLEAVPVEVTSPTQITLLRDLTQPIAKKRLVVSKLLQKGITNGQFNNLGDEVANVQKVLINNDYNRYHVLTSSVPDYDVSLNANNNSLPKSFSISGGNLGFRSDSQILIDSHNYKTGEKVRFTLAGIGSTVISESLYVKSIDSDTLTLGLSRSSLSSGNYVNISDYRSKVGVGTVVTLVRDEFHNKVIKDQEKIRYIKTDKNSGEIYKFEDKKYIPFGVLANGVDLYPPFANNEITFGRIEEVDVIDGGSEFDVINPPQAVVGNTLVGTGASVKLSVEGSLKEIVITNKGSDIIGSPSIKVLGGDNRDVKLKPVVINDYPSKIFSAESNVSLLTDTITFSSTHIFETGDRVKYSVVGVGTAVGLAGGGTLISDAEYYIIRVSSTEVKLANTLEDAYANTAINLGNSFGSGDQRLTSVKTKRIFDRIDIENPGKFRAHEISFTTPVRSYPPSNSYEYILKGINVESDYIYYKNHGFRDSDLILYTAASTAISGLTSGDYYYVLKIDDNRFRLAYAGSDIEDLSILNYKKNIHVRISELPTATNHTFKIPPITLSIVDDFAAISPQIEPIIRGNINHCVVHSEGSKYGSEIMDFISYPNIEIQKGTAADVRLIVLNGRIEAAYVLNGGSGYHSLPEIKVDAGMSKGNYARLHPVISNGKLIEVKIINSGSNYDSTATAIITTPGKDQDFDIKIQKWKVDAVHRNVLNNALNFTDNEHYIIPGNADTIQVVSSYVPKKLRSKFGDNENRRDSDIISDVFSHSPILGWAFDGNPIYGQFGYENPTSINEGTKRLKSSYSRIPDSIQESNTNRPNLNDYPNGYFIEDYYYDDTVGDLDELNGRYCITPEYPEGTYAYFSCLDANGNPAFPYCVYGLRGRYLAENFDFVKSRQQYVKDIVNDLITCTSPYRIDEENFEYRFLTDIVDKEVLLVSTQQQSKVTDVSILNSGTGYKVGDRINIKNDEDFGRDAEAVVSSINGVGITTITTTKNQRNNVFFETTADQVNVIVGEPHTFANRDNVRVVVSGITTNNYTFLNETYPINVKKLTAALVEDVTLAGISTYIKVSDGLESLDIKPDDVIKIDNEEMKVYRVDYDLNQIKVQRASNSTTQAAHTAPNVIDVLPSSFQFKTGIQTNVYTPRYNKVYFEKSQIGIGSTARTTINYVGVQTQIAIQPKKIYIPNHGFSNNIRVQYNFDTAVGLGLTVAPTSDLTNYYQLNDGDFLYIVKYDNDNIGLSSIPIKVGSALTNANTDLGFYFPFSTDDLYEQSLTFNELPSGNVFELSTVINTKQPHNLNVGDEIDLKVNPKFTDQVQFLYDSTYQCLKLPRVTFLNTGISSNRNTVTIANHGFKDGDRVIYTTDNGTILGPDFVEGEIYHLRVFSNNEFSFSNSAEDVRIDNVLGITTNFGTYGLEQVNPQIISVKGSKLKITGISTLTPELEFYENDGYNIEELLDTTSFVFESDSITIDTAKISSEIFILPVIEGRAFDSARDEQTSVKVVDSVYDNIYTVTGIPSTTQFNIELIGNPRILSYTDNNSSPKYTTSAKSGIGSISNVSILNSGLSFKFPTGLATAKSDSGTGAIFGYKLTKEIGGSNDITNVNYQFDFSSDPTYKINLDVPSIVSLKSNNKIEYIEVVDPGKGYVSPPKIRVLDQPTIYSVANLYGNSIGSVDLLSKDNSVLLDDVVVYGDFHSNGVEVTNVTVENDNQTVNLFLKEPNNGFNEFPFAVDDEIYVDGVVITPDTGTGFNSKDYDFTYFKVTRIVTTPGNVSIRYNITGLGVTTGVFDPDLSYSRVIKKDDLAKFKAVLSTSDYTPGERVVSSNGYSADVIENGWSPDTKILSLVNQTGTVVPGEVLTGSKSGTKAIVTQVTDFETSVKRDSVNKTPIDNVDDYSKPNVINQAISDNFYYQAFSYDIISNVPYDTWSSTVSDLSHLSGFEKFGTLNIHQDSNSVGFGSNQSESTSSIIIITESLNIEKVYDFDLVNENIIDTGEFNLSNELTFNARELTDSVVAVSNKVTLIDDISPQFTGYYDAENGGKFVGLTSFRLTSSETGITTSLFVKQVSAGNTSTVQLDTNRIRIPRHNFSTGERLFYSGIGTERISIASTDKVLGGITTDKLPSELYAISLDQDHIRLSGIQTFTQHPFRPENYFDITGVGTGTHEFKSTSQNERCMLLIDGIVQTPLAKSSIDVSLAENVGVGSTTIRLAGITSIASNTLLEIDGEIMKVGVVGFGSTNVVTVERGLMGTAPAAHTVSSAATVRSGQYIIRDDVVFFSNPPLSGINTEFNYAQTGIPTSYSAYNFHGRVFNRVNYDTNQIFDDISQGFDGTVDTFGLTSDGQSSENIFSNVSGIITGTDVSSGVILINNIFQIPNTDYNLIQNVGVGASIEFLGTDNETIPSGGFIYEFEIDRGAGYQEPTRAIATIDSSQVTGGSITGLTLVAGGSGYTEDTLVTVLDSNPGTGATIYALVGSGTQAGIITGFRIDDGGQNYTTSGAGVVVEIPSPTTYSNLNLIGGTGSGARGDLRIIGAGGTTFEFDLNEKGIGYREGDVLTVTGIPTSPGASVYRDFTLTVKSVSRDDFSGYTFGEMVLFDDISDQANGGRVAFSLTRSITGTKQLVSLDTDDDSFILANNLLIFINDILQIPNEAYTFTGGTKIVFKEPPKAGSKIVILYYKGSDDDIKVNDILETVKIGDYLQIGSTPSANLQAEKSRVVFDIPSSDVAITENYSNVGLGTDPDLLRLVNWEKQKNDLIINGTPVYKTRPELISKVVPNSNIIKNISINDTDIFVDTSKLFGIDGLLETAKDITIFDTTFSSFSQAKAGLAVTDTQVGFVTITFGGSGYYEAPQVSVISPVPLEPIIGNNYTTTVGVQAQTSQSGIVTYTGLNYINGTVTINNVPTVQVSSGSSIIITNGSSLIIEGINFSDKIFRGSTYVNDQDVWIIVGDGVIGISTTSNDFDVLVEPQEVSEEYINFQFRAVHSGIHTGAQSIQNIGIAGSSVVGYSTLPLGPWNLTTEAYPPVIGGIVGNTLLDPADRVGLSSFFFNDIKFFGSTESDRKIVAVGNTIVCTGVSGTYGEDWQMLNINSSIGGPEGKILNAIDYYDNDDNATPAAPRSSGYVIVGDESYIFKSTDGIKWNTDQSAGLNFQVDPTGLPETNFNGVASSKDGSIVAVGDNGVIVRATTLKRSSDPWSIHFTEVGGVTYRGQFVDVVYTNQAYVAITSEGRTFTSPTGQNWDERVIGSIVGTGVTVYDINFNNTQTEPAVVAVGYRTETAGNISGSISYSRFAIVEAEVTSTVSAAGTVIGLQIASPGYGYSSVAPDLPIIQIAPPVNKIEVIDNVKDEGDFGNVVAISTISGINTSVAFKFEIETDSVLNSTLYDFNITRSGITTGYYFAISNSIFSDWQEFYPVDENNDTICELTNFNGVYRATAVESDGVSGIVTVISDVHNLSLVDVDDRLSGITTDNYEFIAKYSWGRIYDFDRPDPKSFNIKQQFVGLSSNPKVVRTTQLLQSY